MGIVSCKCKPKIGSIRYSVSVVFMLLFQDGEFLLTIPVFQLSNNGAGRCLSTEYSSFHSTDHANAHQHNVRGAPCTVIVYGVSNFRYCNSAYYLSTLVVSSTGDLADMRYAGFR